MNRIVYNYWISYPSRFCDGGRVHRKYCSFAGDTHGYWSIEVPDGNIINGNYIADCKLCGGRHEET